MNKNKFRLIGLTALLFLLAACRPAITPESAEEQPAVNAIVVLPATVGEPVKGSEPGEKGKQLAGGTQVLNTLLGEYFANRPAVRLLAEAPTENLAPDEVKSPGAMARAIGQQHGADAVLAVTLTRFVERHGNEYDVSHPASVAFELKLISVASGKTLWVGAYDKTQQSLSENLLAFTDVLRRHFTWVTAEALARDGIQDKLASCPFLPPAKP